LEGDDARILAKAPAEAAEMTGRGIAALTWLYSAAWPC
jgi:hypothetical protein